MCALMLMPGSLGSGRRMFAPGGFALPRWWASAFLGLALLAGPGAAKASAPDGRPAPAVAVAGGSLPTGAPVTLQALVDAAVSGHPLARGAI